MFGKKNITKLSDEKILQLFKTLGKTKYLEELYNRYIFLLYGVCLKYLQNANQAQAAVIQLFDILLPKISESEIKSFRTWIYNEVKNHCLQLLKKDNREIHMDFNVDSTEFDEILWLLSEEEKNEELKRYLRELPVQQRVAINRFFYEEMSYADIASSTGYNLSQVKNHIQEGKRILKNRIEKNRQ